MVSIPPRVQTPILRLEPNRLLEPLWTIASAPRPSAVEIVSHFIGGAGFACVGVSLDAVCVVLARRFEEEV